MEFCDLDEEKEIYNAVLSNIMDRKTASKKELYQSGVFVSEQMYDNIVYSPGRVKGDPKFGELMNTWGDSVVMKMTNGPQGFTNSMGKFLSKIESTLSQGTSSQIINAWRQRYSASKNGEKYDKSKYEEFKKYMEKNGYDLLKSHIDGINNVLVPYVNTYRSVGLQMLLFFHSGFRIVYNDVIGGGKWSHHAIGLASDLDFIGLTANATIQMLWDLGVFTQKIVNKPPLLQIGFYVAPATRDLLFSRGFSQHLTGGSEKQVKVGSSNQVKQILTDVTRNNIDINIGGKSFKISPLQEACMKDAGGYFSPMRFMHVGCGKISNPLPYGWNTQNRSSVYISIGNEVSEVGKIYNGNTYNRTQYYDEMW